MWMCGVALIPAALMVVRVDMKHLCFISGRHFLPDLVLHVPLAEQKDLSKWRKDNIPGRLGAGVISIIAALLNPAATVLRLSLSPLTLT